jgi:hypothetical protein
MVVRAVVTIGAVALAVALADGFAAVPSSASVLQAQTPSRSSSWVARSATVEPKVAHKSAWVMRARGGATKLHAATVTDVSVCV